MTSFLQKPFVWAVGIILLILGGVYLLFGSGPSAPPQDQPVVQSHRSYELEMTSDISNIQPDQSAKITYRVKNDQGEIFKNFATVHEKIMHFIVVRKDLQEFQHLHPEYNQATGEFALNITFPTNGTYRIFPDFTPAKSADNPQLLPVTLSHDIAVGNASNYKAQPVVADNATTKTLDGYQITYAIPKSLEAQNPMSYTLTIEKDGQPVKNLQSYLGALGHSVILKADTLDFIHTHAESVNGTGPDITFSTSFPETGIYKTFTQFQHEDKVLTTEYVIAVAQNTATQPNNEQPQHGGGNEPASQINH